MKISPTSDQWRGTPNQWLEHEPRLQAVVDVMQRYPDVNLSLDQMMAILPVVAKLLAPKPAAITPAVAPIASKPAPSRIFSPAQTAAPAAPAVAALPAKPPTTAPERKPFERALQTVCGPTPGLGRLWSFPTQDQPAQATPKSKRWDRALRNATSGNSRYSMPDDSAA
jgi:hypothetical protein